MRRSPTSVAFRVSYRRPLYVSFISRKYTRVVHLSSAVCVASCSTLSVRIAKRTTSDDNRTMSGKRNVGGRPGKLTEELSEGIVASIRRGNYIETAANINGVSKPSVFAWMKKGREQKNGIYRRFLDALLKAQSEFEAEMLGIVDMHAHKDWRAAAWRLEHMRPRRFAQKAKIEHTGKGGGPIQTAELSSMTDEQLEAIARGGK